MVDVNFENLPAPIGFVISLQNSNLWDYEQDGVESERPPKLQKVFGSDSFDIVYSEAEPGKAFPWHTHEPHTADLFWVLEGKIRLNFKDNDGEVHSKEASGEDEEIIYVPAGAHNKIEVLGDTTARVLNFKTHGGVVNGRIEHLVGDTDKHYDPKTDKLKPSLDILPRRGHVFHQDEDSVTEW